MNCFGKKGFTLIELLVVIAIIGILSAVVLTSLQESRDRAKNTSIITEAKNLSKLLTYCEEGLDYQECEDLSFGQCSNSLTTNERSIVRSGSHPVRTRIAEVYAADCGWRPASATGLCSISSGQVTLSEAQDFCSSNGGRLCSIDELGITGGSGCSFDNSQNWTTTTCVGNDGEVGILTARGSRTNYNNPAFHTCVTDLQNVTGTISCCSENAY